MIASKADLEPQSADPLPNSTRVYVEGTLHPDVRVPMREIALSPTKGLSGTVEVNEPVRVYDTSGPWGDRLLTATWKRASPPCAATGF